MVESQPSKHGRLHHSPRGDPGVFRDLSWLRGAERFHNIDVEEHFDFEFISFEAFENVSEVFEIEDFW